MTELFTTVQNSSDEELKPCPFCGGKPVTDFERDTAHGLIGDIISWSIYCTECYAELFSNESSEDVVEKWNRRVSE